MMISAVEKLGWVQRMMGHETLQMIHEKYYFNIKNYQRNDDKAFMENVYNNVMSEKVDETYEKVVTFEGN